MVGAGLGCARASGPDDAHEQTIGRFLRLLGPPSPDREQAFAQIHEGWELGFAPMLLETIGLSQDPGFTGRLLGLLEEKTGQAFGY